MLTCSLVTFVLFRGVDGVYRFDGKFIAQAHASCLSHYIEALAANIPTICIDNTNSTRWEFVNYIKLAHAFQYSCIVLEVECPHQGFVTLFHQRNTHQVPLPSCLTMFKRWEKGNK